MNRRGFLGSILVACAAPAIVRADSLMRIVPIDTDVMLGRVHGMRWHGDRIIVRRWRRPRHDETEYSMIAPVAGPLICEEFTMTVEQYKRQYAR